MVQYFYFLLKQCQTALTQQINEKLKYLHLSTKIRPFQFCLFMSWMGQTMPFAMISLVKEGGHGVFMAMLENGQINECTRFGHFSHIVRNVYAHAKQCSAVAAALL